MTSLTGKLESISLQEHHKQASSTSIPGLQETRQLMLFESHLTQLDTKTIPKGNIKYSYYSYKPILWKLSFTFSIQIGRYAHWCQFRHLGIPKN
jgi:hypothetical protein